MFSKISRWVRGRGKSFDLFPEYIKSIRTEFSDVFWGVGVGLGVPYLAFTIYSLFKTPPPVANWAAVIGAITLAGYYLWRADHIRLMPKLAVKILCAPNETDTEEHGVTNLFIQIIPECLTDAPIHACRARLLQVSKRFEDGDWRLTSMDSPLFLGWDYYGSGEFTIEPGIKQRLNVCYWSNRIRFIMPAVDPIPSKVRNIFNDFEDFKFDIRLTAKECKPVDVSVIVSLHNQEWNKPYISLTQGH